MLDFSDITLINSIITRIYVSVAALIFSIPISFVLVRKNITALPPLWALLDQVFLKRLYKLNAEKRTEHDLFFRGLILVCFFIIITALLILAINSLSGSYYGFLILTLCLASGSSAFLSKKMSNALQNDKKPAQEIIKLLETSNMRSLSHADAPALYRQLVSFNIYNYTQHIIAPALFYILGGLPLLLFGSIFLWLGHVCGRNTLNGPFTYAITIFEQLLIMIPNFIGAVLIVIATLLTPKTSFKSSLNALSLKHEGHIMPGIHPLSIMAHASNCSLGGKEKSYHGDMIEQPWYGPNKATAKIDKSTLTKALYLTLVAHLLFVFTLMLFI